MPNNLVSLKPAVVLCRIQITLTNKLLPVLRHRMMTSLVTWLCSKKFVFANYDENSLLLKKQSYAAWSTLAWGISDCPGTEQNINIKGATCNFQKVGVWVQVHIWRCIKCEETTNHMLVDIYMLSTFLSLLLLWRHRSRDQSGPHF